MPHRPDDSQREIAQDGVGNCRVPADPPVPPNHLLNCRAMNYLSGKHILLGVTGGIAAYKSAELVRLLRSQGAAVRVVMTSAAPSLVIVAPTARRSFGRTPRSTKPALEEVALP